MLDLSDKLFKKFFDSNMILDGIDLATEIDRLDVLTQYTTKDNITRIYDYLIAGAPFSTDTDEYTKTLEIAYQISLNVGEYPYALRAALKLDKKDLVKEAFEACQDPIIKKQLAFQIGRQRVILECEDEDLMELMSNSMLSEYFIKLCEDLDVLTPKPPKDVYKAAGDEDYTVKLDSAQENLADTYVNAFTNLGTGKDTLMKQQEPWIANVKKEGILAATASLGVIHLWDFDGCSDSINDYLQLKDGFAKAGACIGVGLSASGVWSDFDPAKALLGEHIKSADETTRLGAAIGLGLAYAGTAREDLQEDLCEIITDCNIGPDVAGFAALSLGLIFVGTCDEEVSNTILSALFGRPESELSQVSARFFIIGLALNYLGQQEKAEACIDSLAAIEHPIGSYAQVCVEAAAYIGSGNVLKVQESLKRCITHHTEDDKTLPQAMSVLGIAFISISEPIGNQMALRTLHHILQYCELPVRR